MLVDLNDVIEKLKRLHPDKMLLDDIDAFNRGRLAGEVGIILELEAMEDNEEEEDG